MIEERIIPSEQFILLRDGAEEQKTSSGLVLTAKSAAIQKMVPGIVDDMGYNMTYKFKTAFGEEKEIRNGDKVLYEAARGTLINFNGKQYIMIPTLNITALIDRKDV